MGAVRGSASGAKTLGDDVINCVGDVVNELGDIESKLAKLGQTFQDEEYRDIEAAIKKITKATEDILPTLKAVKPKLDQYANILTRAQLKL
mgnify:CR=1 FL=1